MRPRRLDFGVELLMGRARARSLREGAPLPRALAELYEFTRVRVQRRLEVTAACSLSGHPLGAAREPPRFLCDASLGGLARWLRAAGYEAEWRPELRGALLVGEAERLGLTLVTTDSALPGMRAVRAERVAVAWVPSTMTRSEQLRMVLRDLSLGLRAPRCMGCGGVLAPVAKDDVLGRIPPRTRAWKDEYFRCDRCGTLFWQGTHWERIARQLALTNDAR